jgi:hypothetical protein
MNPNTLKSGRAIDGLDFLTTYGKSRKESSFHGGPYTERIENMLNAPKNIRFDGSFKGEARKIWRKIRDAYSGKRSNLER